MTFVLNKDITRRRRLPAGDGDTKGDEGTFAYNMRSGKCVEDDSGTACGNIQCRMLTNWPDVEELAEAEIEF